MKRTVIAIALLLSAPSVLHAWNGTPILVDGVTSGPSEVAVAHDGDYGALIAWQTAGASGELRVTHLLADGSHDPAWPLGGLALANGLGARTGLVAIEDGLDGAYLLWREGTSLYLSRVLASGTVAQGWTARGRLLGLLSGASHRPWIEQDGAGGVYVGMFQGSRDEVSAPGVRIFHLGPDGVGAGGWPSGPRSLHLSGEYPEWVHSASFAIAEDGGVWVLVATGRVEEGIVHPGEWRLGRLMANGVLDPGLPLGGATLGAFEADQIGPYVPRLALGAVVADGEGGVLTAQARVSGEYPGFWYGSFELTRRAADGSVHPQQGTPAIAGAFQELYTPAASSIADYSVQLRPDGLGGMTLAVPYVFTHSGYVLRLSSIDRFGSSVGPVGPWVANLGVSLTPAAGGGFLHSSYDPRGPGHPSYDPGWAHIAFGPTSGAWSWLEETFSPSGNVYAALSAASLPDGGAVGAWSRIMSGEMGTGLFAIRVGSNGSALSVPATSAAAPRLRLTREPRGLRASWSAGAPGVLRVHDVQGREVARHEVGEAPGEALLEPAGGASPGILFARLLRRDGMREAARAVLLR